MLKLTVKVLLVSALLACNVYAVESKLEASLGNNETVLKYESYESGTMGGSLDVKFTAMVVTDPVKATTVASGVKVTILGDKDAKSTVFMDLDEVQSLSNAIALVKSISEKNATEKLEANTEVVYSSKGGFKFGYLNRGTGAGMFDSKSSLFIRTPAMESIIKDDEKRFGQLQTIIASVLFNVGKK